MSIYCDDFENIINMLRFATNEGRKHPDKKVYVVYDEELFEVFDESSFVDFASDQADEIVDDYYDQSLVDFAENFDKNNLEDCAKVLEIRDFDIVAI